MHLEIGVLVGRALDRFNAPPAPFEGVVQTSTIDRPVKLEGYFTGTANVSDQEPSGSLAASIVAPSEIARDGRNDVRSQSLAHR